MAFITVVVAAEPRHQALCRRSLERESGIAVAAEAPPGAGALALAARLRPDVLLLDFTRARLDVLARLPGIRHRAAGTRVLLLTAPRTAETLILEALNRGARGYLDDAAIPALLGRAVRALHAGEAWVPRRMVSKLLDRLLRLAEAERKARRAAAPGARRRSSAHAPLRREVAP